jgi:signal transduction histidine kinase
MQRDLALYLHSTVQAGLVASAYAMQDAAARGDEDALEQAIIEARGAAARVGEHALAPVERELAAMRASIDETWQGLLDVGWTLPAGALEAQQLERVSNVVQECLANALIHGAATEATVRIVIEDDCAIVELTDNGRGVGDGKPGLGSAVLNEATAGQWTIATVPTGGAQVRAVVPN